MMNSYLCSISSKAPLDKLEHPRALSLKRLIDIDRFGGYQINQSNESYTNPYVSCISEELSLM